VNVGILGLGLIGGSLGYDLRDRGHRVFGVSRRPETCDAAVELGAVDCASPDLCSLAAAEVIFICTPLDAIAATVEALALQIPPETVLTDVGSVKAPIVKAVAPLWSNFVGGHPLAGTEASGIAAAQRHLFAGRPYVLSPGLDTPAHAIAAVEQLATAIGADVCRCAPDIHDRAVAAISHALPLVSAASILACLDVPDPEVAQVARQLASSGFRDTSRVGGGNPELGASMARHNREATLAALERYRQALARLEGYVRDRDWEALESTLERTRAERPQFLRAPTDA